MRAMVLHGLGRPLVLEDVADPRVGPNEVKIRVRAIGVGLTVVHMLANPGQVTAYPRIPGHEVAGEIVELGSEVRGFTVGQRVTNHFYLTCGQCRFCRAGRETLCTAFRGYVGMACDGGYAEYMTLPARNFVPIPDGVSDVDAAVAADAIATPFHACTKEAQVQPGDNVLVFGAGGGVGVHVVQVAKAAGARVIAVEIGESKLSGAQAAGADELIDGARGDVAKQVLALTDGRGVEAVIDVVGAKETLEASVLALAAGGRLVIVGVRPAAVFGDSSKFTLDATMIVRKGIEVRGSRYVTATEIAQTLELLRQKRVRAIVEQTFALEQAEHVHQLIRENRVVGRVALRVD
ncbi:MAG: alcohol dehydrogenase catalytic domain-containing protein [Proteobacteria bacterium]|nr:alcohol dehydrogenase catalytic domain-containing protein [Burkholderiales bacterium]